MRQLSLVHASTPFLTTALALVAAGVIGQLAGCAPAGPALGDLVWRDSNRNGLQDPAEPGAAGITVSLYNEAGALVSSTTSDQLGGYQFSDVPSGRYTLTFVALQDNRFTLHNADDDDAADSDADPLTGQTEAFDFNPGQPNLTFDAGLIEVEPTPTPAPPATPTPTPVVPAEGGTYQIEVTFVLDQGTCGGPAQFNDSLRIEIGPDGTSITFTQPSTGDVNIGTINPDGTFDVSSASEAYVGTLEFVRDDAGSVVRVILRALNQFEYTQGCINYYEVEGEVDIVGEGG